ncbi:response regulator transcription factor [Zoogloea sp.]|uniref:response regulator transcription factor n=1 Tax=Zoogloea sp. TaxID=49181 RepID=UPI0026035745|nr:response regulator transcription factor [Zoogloea sp.]MDD3353520.1 response regulator transcription factor [Zoogloea sp.]
MSTTRTPELIYVVEDEAAIARLIADTLEKFGYKAELFRTAEAFFHGLRHTVPELVILDLGLPDMDGMTVLQQLRGKHACGLLVVTGRSDTYDRVMGLELGADDYVIKPFEPRELIARVRSILRRYPGAVVMPADPATRVAEFAGWRFEPGSNTLTSPSGEQETLSTAEAQLLSVLLAHPNHILTREQLLGGRDVSALDRSIDLRISRLRRRFEENPQHAKLIKTVYGAGYLLAATVSWS